MNALSRTMIAISVLCFVAAGSVSAQNLPDENSREALASQREAQIAEEQAEAAQKQREAARRQALVAEATPARATATAPPAAPATPNAVPAPLPAVPSPPAPPGEISVSAPYISFTGVRPSRAGGASSVLVIPSAEISAEDIFAITEDMNVMSRIFEKNLDQARITTARGGLFPSRRDPFIALLGADSGAIESMYLQGYGALFFVKVDFPLSGPPQVKEEMAPEQEESDPVWEEMRRQMYEPQQSARRKAKESEEKYDPEKVEILKTTLIGGLKHAANIRSLKPDESVILTITGSGGSGGTGPTVLSGRTISLPGRNQVIVQEKDNDGKITTRLVQTPSTDIAGSFTPTILVIRAKKSDIDEFGKGNLELDQFRQRTQVLVCPYLGGETGRRDSLNAYY